MTTVNTSRRDVARHIATALAGVALAVTPRRLRAAPQHEEDLTRDAEAIHQVLTFAVAPARVYETLTSPKEFSALMKYGTVPNAPPAELTARPGDEFRLFGGHVLGRNIELVPGTRVVQAWRASDWPAGLYSIVRFELRANGTGTTLTFDHTGFPKGQGKHLAEGWYLNYWTPMQKYLGTK